MTMALIDAFRRSGAERTTLSIGGSIGNILGETTNATATTGFGIKGLTATAATGSIGTITVGADVTLDGWWLSKLNILGNVVPSTSGGSGAILQSIQFWDANGDQGSTPPSGFPNELLSGQIADAVLQRRTV